jgi:ERCC4-type nuclease
MLDLYQVNYLLIEGSMRAGLGGQLEVLGARAQQRYGWIPPIQGSRPLTWNAVQSFLTTLEDEAGLRLRFPATRKETADTIAQLYFRWQKASHKSMHQIHQLPAVHAMKAGIVQRVAAQFGGVGVERARAAVRVFKTVKDMVLAGEKQWQGVEGVGKETAGKVWREIRGIKDSNAIQKPRGQEEKP